MSYTPNISNFLTLAQRQMLANFQTINTSFFQNHVSLLTNENFGRHTYLTLRPQVGDPTTGATQCAFYNKVVSTVPQLFFRPINNGTPIQMSNANLNTLQTGAPASTQVSFMAGPFTIYMGFILSCANGQLVQLLPSTTLRYVGLSTNLIGGVLPSLATTATATSISGNQFNVAYNAAQFFNNATPPVFFAPNIYYMAIGQ